MNNTNSEKLNTHTVANAFNLAISSSTINLSTLIVYNNKELAIDLCSVIHSRRQGRIHYLNLDRFHDSDALKKYLFKESSVSNDFIGIPDSGTLVFENIDLITKPFQQIIRAFYDRNEREQLGYKMIFLSRSTLEEERASGLYDASLYYRVSGAIIDCRLAHSF